MESKVFACNFTLRAWAVGVGRFQIGIAIVGALAISVYCISHVARQKGPLISLIIVLLIMIALSIGFVWLGARLLGEIKNKKTGRMLRWVVVEGIVAGIGIIATVVLVIQGNMESLGNVGMIVLGFLKMWIVLKYRQEILEYEKRQLEIEANGAINVEMTSIPLHGNPHFI